ncbi:MAG: hypothetical protein KKF54_08040 [Candidatus Omnitrophica bacterium]|nr:hypothetical protein [Candidatus Omnitrophota bacterium]
MSPKTVLIMNKHNNQSKRARGSADKIGFTRGSPSGHQDARKRDFCYLFNYAKGYLSYKKVGARP